MKCTPSVPTKHSVTLFGRFARAAIALLITAVMAHAAEPAPPAPLPPPKKWDTTMTLGATLTRGNSKTFLGTGLINTKRNWTADEALFGASAGYGKTTTGDSDTVTDSYIKGFGQWNHLFSPRTYAGLRVTGEHDDIAHLGYRLTVGPLLGYYFVKQTNSFLAGEIGPSFVQEKFFHESPHNYLGLRFAERGEHKFPTGSKIWENVEWIPKAEDMQNYLVNAEAGVSAPLSKALGLSLIVQDTYKSEPALGRLKNDVKLIAGVTYTF